MLEALREALAAPVNAGKPRSVLRRRKNFCSKWVRSAPTRCAMASRSIHAVGKQWAWVLAWRQDGWGAFVVAERGHVFDFLAWHRPLVTTEPIDAEPTLAELEKPHPGRLRNPGMLTAR